MAKSVPLYVGSQNAGITICELLPYNPGGIAKRIATGKEIPPDIPRTMMRIEEEKKFEEIFA